MSWWKKLLGSSEGQRASELRFPVVIELIPGALSASVHSHTLSTGRVEVPCWSYVSKGLQTVEHEEVDITLRREVDEPDGAFPDDPLRLFRLFHQLGGQGHRVGPGDVSELGGKRFFGHHLVYARPPIAAWSGGPASASHSRSRRQEARARGPAVATSRSYTEGRKMARCSSRMDLLSS